MQRNDQPNLWSGYKSMRRWINGAQITFVVNFFQQVHQLADHLNFKNMKANPSVNKEDYKQSWTGPSNDATFLRKGEVGNWKQYFSPELNEKVDKWITDHLKGSDLKFCFEV